MFISKFASYNDSKLHTNIERHHLFIITRSIISPTSNLQVKLIHRTMKHRGAVQHVRHQEPEHQLDLLINGQKYTKRMSGPATKATHT